MLARYVGRRPALHRKCDTEFPPQPGWHNCRSGDAKSGGAVGWPPVQACGRVPPVTERRHVPIMLTNFVIFAFAVGLVVAYVVIAIKTVNESES